MSSDSNRPGHSPRGWRSRRRAVPYIVAGALHIGGREIESADAICRAAADDGRRHGAVRSPARIVTDEGSAMHAVVAGASKARKGQAKAAAHDASRAANETYATADARKRGKEAEKQHIKWRITRTSDEFKVAAGVCEKAEENLSKAERDYELRPQHEKGYFGLPTVLLVEMFVAGFDGAVIHDALERSGTSNTTMWLTSIGVPLLIGGCNHGMGVLAGVIGRLTPKEKRLSLVATAFASGMLALVGTFGTLMLFRNLASGELNDSLNALANGATSTPLDFVAPMYWLGPAQLAGSIAAISLVALWAMAKPGRQALKVVKGLRKIRDKAVGAVQGLRAELEALYEQYKAADLAIHEIEAEKAGAHSQLVVQQRILNADLETEDGIRETITARADVEFEITNKLHENGAVWWAAMPTEQSPFGRRRTPKPRFTAASSDTSRNGHKPSPEAARFN